MTFAGSPSDALVLEARPVATVGDAEGPEWTALGRIGSGEILPDGGFAITDMQALRVHVYDPDGSHRHSMGRRGNGPGEFESINGLSETEGGLEVWDSRQQRLTSFDSDGAFRSSVPAPEGTYLTLMETWDGGGGYLALSLSEEDRNPPDGSEFAVTLAYADVSRVTETGSARLLRVPYLQAGQALRDGRPMMVTLPFPYRGRVALFDEGVAVVYSGEPEVLQYDREGALQRRIRFPAFDRLLEDAVVDSMRAEALAGAAAPALRELVETSYSLAVPERMPTFEHVRTDGDDLILGLHRAWAFDGRQPWLFVSPADQRVGVLWLSDGESILDVDGDHVLVAGSTPAGVPRVTLLEIDRGLVRRE